MQGLSFRFALRCTDLQLGRYLESVLRPLRAPVPVAHWYSMVTTSAGRVDLFLDYERVAQLSDSRTAAEWFLWELNRAVVEQSSEHLLFHAGGVQAGERGILVPAPTGSGKSTLVAGLVCAGLAYLSDEVMAYDASSKKLLPYPKSLNLKRGSFGLLPEVERVVRNSIAAAGLPPAEHGSSASATRYVSEVPVSPSDLRPGAVGSACQASLVVVPRYVPGGSGSLRRLSAEEMFLALATNTVNLDRRGSEGARALGGLVEQCDGYELEMSDLDQACRLVLGLLDGSQVSAAGGG